LWNKDNLMLHVGHLFYNRIMSGASAFDDDFEPLPCMPTLLDAQLVPDDVAAWAAGGPPGSAVLGPLLVLDPRRLSPEGRVDTLAAIEKQLALLQARQHRLLAVMAAEPIIKTPLGELDKQWAHEASPTFPGTRDRHAVSMISSTAGSMRTRRSRNVRHPIDRGGSPAKPQVVRTASRIRGILTCGHSSSRCV
jgi:hypothetical protein